MRLAAAVVGARLGSRRKFRQPLFGGFRDGRSHGQLTGAFVEKEISK